jgi:hypothetical protein
MIEAVLGEGDIRSGRPGVAIVVGIEGTYGATAMASVVPHLDLLGVEHVNASLGGDERETPARLFFATSRPITAEVLRRRPAEMIATVGEDQMVGA